MATARTRTVVRWTLRGLLTVVLIALLVWALWPRPIPVDMAQATRGRLEVGITDDGQARVREVYVVSAPTAGRVLRTELEVGDVVAAGETVVARILPSDPAMLDVRSRTELQAAIGTAEAALTLAEAEVRQATAGLAFSQSEYDRISELSERGTVSRATLDRARLELETARAALESAEAGQHMREHELDVARAALIDPTTPNSDIDLDNCCLAVTAPIDGTILRTVQESEVVVAAGTPLVEIGDPRDLEVVVDLLSSDAVRISEGAPVRIDNWGGPWPLNGQVERIEPYAVSRTSALGIEEQRVDVVVALTDPPEDRARLGHGYRVDARILLREDDDVLQVPLGAVFRQGRDWAVFRVIDGTAVLTLISGGALTDTTAEITNGLDAGDTVILHPSSEVGDGVSVTPYGVD